MAAEPAPILRWAPTVTLIVFLGPVAAGLVGTLLPAFGYFPALGGDRFSLDPWRALAAYPGVADAAFRGLWTGLAAAGLSTLLVFAFIAAAHDTKWFDRARAILAPLLAMPHVALAIGLAFLLAPSGWILRVISPWATGFDRPPDFTMAPDPHGWSLVIALVVKETPFLFLMAMGALNQIPARQSMRVARSLGHGRMGGWLKTVLPRLYPQMRLPIFAAVAFSVSVVDVAIVMTTTPAPTLSVLILRWANDPDLARQFLAAAGACLQVGVVVIALTLWIVAEHIARAVGRMWIRRGRQSDFAAPRPLAIGALGMIAGLGILGLVGLAIWSLAHRWRFPDALPGTWTLGNWTRKADLLTEPMMTTLWLGLAAAGVALVLVLTCLESERRLGRRPGNRALWLLYTPLIVPQVAFLFGAQILLVSLGIDGHWAGLVWAHLLFVLPYVFLSLADPYRALDPRYARAARCLGARPWRVFTRVTLPMMIRPVMIAFAVGFAVSVGEYLPTVFAGAGRLTTLTTEAVALAGGGDRRTIGALVVLQGILPLALLGIAALAPVLLRRAAFRRIGTS